MKTLLKFYAPWCQPCKALSGALKYVDLKDIELKEIDIDQDPNMAKEYSVRSIPTLVLLQDGKEVSRKTGVLMADQLEQFINS